MDRVEAVRLFKALNHARITHLRTMGAAKHAIFYDLLPLLFHINDPELPGYIDDDVPAGIIDYRAEPLLLEKARHYLKGFNHKRQALRRYPIRGLYLVNSAGLCHYPQYPDYQLWLIGAANLTDKQQQLLQQKLDAVSDWAETLGIKLRPRLLNEANIEKAAISVQDLEEFYLNGLVIAGSIPVWWLVAPEDEQEYSKAVAKVMSQSEFNHLNLIDFGACTIDNDASGLFNQLNQASQQAMENGLPSLLNLLFLQSCIGSFPQAPPLPLMFKQQIYAGNTDPMQCDVMVLKLHVLESSLDNDSLDVARQSLYVLCGERLSQNTHRPNTSWRRQFMTETVKQWAWPDTTIKALDQRFNTSYRQSIKQHQQLGQLIRNVHASLFDFARQQQLKVGDARQHLDRLYQLHFEPAPDVIKPIPDLQRPANPYQQLYLYRFAGDTSWQLSDITLDAAATHPLYQDESLLRLLTWAISNQLLGRESWVKVKDQSHQIEISSVMELIQLLLRSTISANTATPDAETLASPPLALQLFLFANLEKQPQDYLSQRGLKMSSLQNDPFNYTSSHQSLVVSVEGLIYSSWGQWHYFSHSGTEAPLEMLTTLLRWHPGNMLRNQTQCWCPTPIFGQAISSRMTRLLDDVLVHHNQNPEHGHYVMAISDHLFALEWQGAQVDYLRLNNNQTIYNYLSSHTGMAPVHIDPYIDPDGLINQMLQYRSPQQISLFIYSGNNQVNIYLLDETGGLIQQKYSEISETTLLSHFHRFLSNVSKLNQVANLRFYRLAKVHNSWQIADMVVQAQQKGYLPVTIEMSAPEDNASCTVFCGDTRFTGNCNDPSLFKQVHDLLMSLRSAGQHYRLYLTSLSFVGNKPFSTMTYLEQKHRLEKLLNPQAGQ